MVSLVAGSQARGDVDGVGAGAQFSLPQGLCVSPDGVSLYVADTANHKIRAIALATGTRASSALAIQSFVGFANRIDAKESVGVVHRSRAIVCRCTPKPCESSDPPVCIAHQAALSATGNSTHVWHWSIAQAR